MLVHDPSLGLDEGEAGEIVAQLVGRRDDRLGRHAARRVRGEGECHHGQPLVLEAEHIEGLRLAGAGDQVGQAEAQHTGAFGRMHAGGDALLAAGEVAAERGAQLGLGHAEAGGAEAEYPVGLRRLGLGLGRARRLGLGRASLPRALRRLGQHAGSVGHQPGQQRPAKKRPAKKRRRRRQAGTPGPPRPGRIPPLAGRAVRPGTVRHRLHGLRPFRAVPRTDHAPRAAASASSASQRASDQRWA
ncbi:MAG: hypothetical protein IT557_20020 [Alphaproteobacteria bacterium]|nr:hypothetical protein [Alphaproteobacteria bacterium]